MVALFVALCCTGAGTGGDGRVAGYAGSVEGGKLVAYEWSSGAERVCWGGELLAVPCWDCGDAAEDSDVPCG